MDFVTASQFQVPVPVSELEQFTSQELHHIEKAAEE